MVYIVLLVVLIIVLMLLAKLTYNVTSFTVFYWTASMEEYCNSLHTLHRSHLRYNPKESRKKERILYTFYTLCCVMSLGVTIASACTLIMNMMDSYL